MSIPRAKSSMELTDFNSETEIKADARPSAYDMPVGSVVTGHDYDGCSKTWTRLHAKASDGWTDKNGLGLGLGLIQSGWIEGLFTDGLVTEWRLP